MTGKRGNKASTKTTVNSANVTLEGKTLEYFNAVKDRIESTIPGLQPKNVEVLRYALYLAAQDIPVKHMDAAQA